MTSPHRIRLAHIRAWAIKNRVAIVAIAIWLMLILLVREYMQTHQLTFVDLTEQLSVVLREGWYGPLLYVLVYLIRPVILFPASLLTILGGSVFGLWPGFAYVLFAGTSSAILPYALGRWFSSDTEQDHGQQSIIQRFSQMLKQNPFQAVLTMRLIYMPYDAVSIVAGNLRISFIMFFLATALGNLAGTLSFVGIGASIEGDLTSGDLSLNPGVLLFSALILVASFMVSRLLNRYQQRQSATNSEKINV